MSVAQAITKHFGGEWRGNEGFIPTPGHSAEDRGTTVRDGVGGDVVFHSFNDRDWRSLKDQCRAEGLLPEFAPSSSAWRVTGNFQYIGEDGTVAYRTVRKEKPGERKRFVAERPDGRGGWSTGIKGVDRIPYRLPELLAAPDDRPVLFVEGERKADKLASWGFVATAIAFGCNGWRPEYAYHLAGRRVVILPDNDQPGRDFAATVKAAIPGAVILDLPGLPAGGDIMDWDGGAEDLLGLVDKALAAPDGGSAESALLPIIDMAAWQGPPPARVSLWGSWLPLLQAIMLTGRGGIGKSLFEQMLCTCIALGLSFLGMETVQRNTLYVTCEDDADELWRRQAAICAALNVPMSALAGKLHLVSLCGQTDTALATFKEDGRIIPTARWRQLEATCEAMAIGLYAFDNATDAMAGDLNDIHQVAEFVNLLTGLAIRQNGVAMILHHPNKAGDDWLGSVAWHNKVRSRLIIRDSENEDDHDERVIMNPKANYGPQGGKIAFRWHNGALVRDEDLPPNIMAEQALNIRAGAENARFLECLDKTAAEQRTTSASPAASNYAPRVFAKMPTAKRMTVASFEAAMQRLFHLGQIAGEQPIFQRANRTWAKGLGRAQTIAQTMHKPGAQSCTEVASKPAETLHKAAHAPDPYTYGNKGAALGTAAPSNEERDRADLNAGYIDEGDPIPSFEDMG